jgi:hypothetical protein
MSAPTTWRGDEDTPRMTAKVLRWYRLRLPAVFYQTHEGKKYPMEPTRRAELVAWYAGRPEDFLIWHAEEEYRGKRYNLGAWRLDIAAINAALPLASREIEAEKRRAAYAARGPVTDTDVEVMMALGRNTTPLTREPSGETLYPNRDDATPFLVNRNKVHCHWPRACRGCGGSFRPKGFHSRRCPDCLAKAKAEREQAKQRP